MPNFPKWFCVPQSLDAQFRWLAPLRAEGMRAVNPNYSGGTSEQGSGDSTSRAAGSCRKRRMLREKQSKKGMAESAEELPRAGGSCRRPLTGEGLVLEARARGLKKAKWPGKQTPGE